MDDVKRILVVDDEEEVCVFLKGMLERAGYQVETTQELPGTVASIVARPFDLVTVDLKMPDMDGVAVAELAHAVDANTAIVVVSAYLTPAAEGQLRETGVRHFVRKPFSSSELLETIATALEEAGQPAE